MFTWSSKLRLGLVAALAIGTLGVTSLDCGFGSTGGSNSAAGSSGSAGTTGTTAGTTGSQGGDTGNPQGGSTGTPQGGSTGTPQGGSTGTPQGGSGGTTTPTGGVTGTTGGMTGSTGGVIGTGGAAPPTTFKNYEVSGSFPRSTLAVAQKPGMLKYTKIVIQNQFLAESCSIADYNGDGIPDVSSGRIWYEGTADPATTFKTAHPFRDGHGALPRTGSDGKELNTGVSDDWADYPWDIDGDGDADIVNIAQCDVPENQSDTLPQTGGPTNPQAAGTPNKIGIVQVHATAYWYENPGKAGQAGDPKWAMHLMHADVRNEQHEMIDMNGDGYPEIVGACRDCGMGDTKGYYQGDPKNPTAAWTYHQVTAHFTFPFGNLGWMHGMGAGDVNGDGLPDFMDRQGAYLQQPGGTFNLTVCTGKDTPKGCGFIQEKTPLLMTGFYDGKPDGAGNKGASHMFAVDMDKDGCSDVVAADWAHGIGLAWYQQKKDATGCTYAFTKFPFMGDAAKTGTYNPSVPGDAAKWGVGFSEPHSLQVYDMDGDGRFDVIAGKMRFAHPLSQGDPDPHGVPYIYVFKNVATPDARNGAPITLQPVLVDGNPGAVEGSQDAGMGVGRQIAIGHVNTDGIVDICVGTKLGLAVFLGQ